MEQIAEFWRISVRRFWIIALVMMAALPLVGLYAYLKIPLYAAEAKIAIVSPRIPEKLAEPTVPSDASERLQVIEQRLMSRGSLLPLIEELGLFDGRIDLTVSEKLTLVREATTIRPVRRADDRGRGGDGLAGFTIRVTSENPQHAAQLVERFVTRVLEENAADRREGIDEQIRFFEKQLALANDNVRSLNTRILEFKAANGDALPENRSLLENGLLEIGGKTDAINQALSEIEGRLRTAKLREEQERLSRRSAELQEEKADLERQRVELEQALQRMPGIQVELEELERRLAAAQEEVNDWADKLASARTGRDLEVQQLAERFEVIEPPTVPTEPVAPNRRKIVVLGGGFAIAFAFGLALLVDRARPRVRSAEQLERVLALRPAITLPYLRTRQEVRRLWLMRIAVVLVICAGIPAGLYVVDHYYMPLPLVFEKLAAVLGADDVIRQFEHRF